MGAAMVTAVAPAIGLAMQLADIRSANGMATNSTATAEGSATGNGSFAEQLSQHSQTLADETAPASRNAKPAGGLAKAPGSATAPCVAEPQPEDSALVLTSDSLATAPGPTPTEAGSGSLLSLGAEAQTPALAQNPGTDTLSLANWIASLLPAAPTQVGVPDVPAQSAMPSTVPTANSTTGTTVQPPALTSSSDPRAMPVRSATPIGKPAASPAPQVAAAAAAAQPLDGAAVTTAQPEALAAIRATRDTPARPAPTASNATTRSPVPMLATADAVPPADSSADAPIESIAEAQPASAQTTAPEHTHLAAMPAADALPAVAPVPPPDAPVARVAESAVPSTEGPRATRAETATVGAIGNGNGNGRVDRSNASPAERDAGPPIAAKAAPVSATNEAAAPGGHGPAGSSEPSITHATAFAHVLDAATQSLAATPPTSGGNQATPTATAVDVNLPTPVMSPEFREALGVQVSVLARDGVQHAELHLNPTDMGPISVRIALDGTQAQVDFGVDTAATRALVESGLPELASALREAGLTLTGGGVSQHARGQSADGWGGRQADGGAPGQGSNGRQRGSAAGEDDVGTALPRPRTVRVAGRVDLYA